MYLLTLRHVAAVVVRGVWRPRPAPAPPQLLEPADGEGEPLLVAEAVEAGVLEVLDADGGGLADAAVALGHEAGPVLLQPQQPQPLLQAPLQHTVQPHTGQHRQARRELQTMMMEINIEIPLPSLVFIAFNLASVSLLNENLKCIPARDSGFRLQYSASRSQISISSCELDFLFRWQ